MSPVQGGASRNHCLTFFLRLCESKEKREDRVVVLPFPFWVDFVAQLKGGVAVALPSPGRPVRVEKADS